MSYNKSDITLTITIFKKRVNARLHKRQDLYDDITSLSLHEHHIQNVISVFFQSPLLSLPQCHLDKKKEKSKFTHYSLATDI